MRRLLLAAPVVGVAAMSALMLTSSLRSAGPDGPAKSVVVPAQTLPVSRVILFNSGVAHFVRSAEIDGDTRIDLTFPENDINDLIKSMTLQDFSDKGRVTAVTYDSREPIERTLKSFAIDLNGSPSFGNILTQARGEAVEVVMAQNAIGQPGTITGKIVGVEKQKVTTKDGSSEVDVLNLWCNEGVRSVRLAEMQKLRFTNPTIENEFRRALETLALSHDSQKKAVSLFFAGEGRRKVSVGYVVENPIWKTSYRLVLDQKEGKPYLQGWGIVENPTDEDWSSVGMALVSGRPISFRMDLYNPLFVPRPLVEPELFASLRPPTYSGAMAKFKRSAPGEVITQSEVAVGSDGEGKSERRWQLDETRENTSAPRDGKEEQLRLKHVDKLDAELGENLDLARAVQTLATASQLGDYFQYVIDRPVTLARQKSALLPIINKEVEAQRVSIYNQGVQAKHPLLGLKFKNTTGANLSQGPIAVFEGSTYAGDTRVLDLQPNEERLVSYAIDLGMEVAPKQMPGSGRITALTAVQGIIYTQTRVREEKLYDVVNRSGKDRILLIEHPNRKGQGFVFVGANKPAEETAELYRFSVPIAAGKSAAYTIGEEHEVGNSISISNSPDDTIRQVINMKEASPAVKAALVQALALKAKWDTSRTEVLDVNTRVVTIERDQDRLRKNLKETPKEAPVFQEYIRKLGEQEKEMNDLSARLKDLQKGEAGYKAVYEKFLRELNVS